MAAKHTIIQSVTPTCGLYSDHFFCQYRQCGQTTAAALIVSAQCGQTLVCSFSAIKLHVAFFHGCNTAGSKLGAGGGSSGSKYQSARYNNTPGNAALKSVPKTQTTRSFDDGTSKCFANPPQTPAIWWSSCERQSFIFVIQLFHRHLLANRKRQRAGALQDADARFENPE